MRPRDPHTMYSGYWNKPDVTVATWRNLWHHTGDFGRMDDRGFVSFVDRMKDRMRRRGENVSSVHLEETLRGMPGVAEVAVCGLPGQLGDDDIKACIVESELGALSAAAVFEFLRDRVAYFAIPRYVQVRQTLPVNAMQRVMKDRLRAEGVPDGCWDLEELGLVVARDDRRGAGKPAPRPDESGRYRASPRFGRLTVAVPGMSSSRSPFSPRSARSTSARPPSSRAPVTTPLKRSSWPG